MFYKKLFLIFNIVNWGGLLLIYVNFVFFSSTTISFYLFIAGILYIVLLASIPGIIEKEKQILVANFGSREDDNVKAHVADLFFRKVLSGRIVTQLDPGNEDHLSTFAENLKGMYGDEVTPRMRNFYPDIPDQRIDEFLNVCVKIGKETMFYVFFPEKRAGADQATAEARLASLYPFMSPTLLRKIYLWWKKFKAKLEWQARMDGSL
jgi:hypothetical protein